MYRWLPVALGLAAAVTAVPAAAQDFSIIRDGIEGCDFVTGNLEVECIPNFIGALVKGIFGLIGIIFMINIMLGGYQIAFSGLTEDKGAGKNRIYYSIFGCFVSVAAFLLVDFVVSALING